MQVETAKMDAENLASNHKYLVHFKNTNQVNAHKLLLIYWLMNNLTIYRQQTEVFFM